jgi:2-phospho-L-lactate guanylyltransferase
MLNDVLAAVKRIPEVQEVLICTSDPDILDEFPRESIWLTTGGGLNSDIEEVLTGPRGQQEGLPTAVVVADLPCLRATDLSQVLGLAAPERGAFVASIDGGTTVLAVTDSRQLIPRFGSRSANEHRRWYRDVSNQVGIGCRLDVDTMGALMFGHGVGLGSRTAHYLAALDGGDGNLSRRDAQRSA